MRVYVFQKENKHLFMTTEKASAMGTPKVYPPLVKFPPWSSRLFHLDRATDRLFLGYGLSRFWGMDLSPAGDSSIGLCARQQEAAEKAADSAHKNSGEMRHREIETGFFSRSGQFLLSSLSVGRSGPFGLYFY